MVGVEESKMPKILRENGLFDSIVTCVLPQVKKWICERFKNIPEIFSNDNFRLRKS